MPTDKKRFNLKEGIKIKKLNNPDYIEYAESLEGAIILSVDGVKAKDVETISNYLSRKENTKARYQIITQNGQRYSIIM
jgi:serine protease Do